MGRRQNSTRVASTMRGAVSCLLVSGAAGSSLENIISDHASFKTSWFPRVELSIRFLVWCVFRHVLLDSKLFLA